jgi:hypothetical protein
MSVDKLFCTRVLLLLFKHGDLSMGQQIYQFGPGVCTDVLVRVHLRAVLTVLLPVDIVRAFA